MNRSDMLEGAFFTFIVLVLIIGGALLYTHSEDVRDLQQQLDTANAQIYELSLEIDATARENREAVKVLGDTLKLNVEEMQSLYGRENLSLMVEELVRLYEDEYDR